jgi:ribosomal protein S3
MKNNKTTMNLKIRSTKSQIIIGTAGSKIHKMLMIMRKRARTRSIRMILNRRLRSYSQTNPNHQLKT